MIKFDDFLNKIYNGLFLSVDINALELFFEKRFWRKGKSQINLEKFNITNCFDFVRLNFLFISNVRNAENLRR